MISFPRSPLFYRRVNKFTTINASPVLNISRVDLDIGRYLVFCLLPIRYGEIVRSYRLQQKTINI